MKLYIGALERGAIQVYFSQNVGNKLSHSVLGDRRIIERLSNILVVGKRKQEERRRFMRAIKISSTRWIAEIIKPIGKRFPEV